MTSRFREPVLLRLPAGRSPPQGAILDLVAEIRRPRGPKDGFDERTWLRRHGVHVVVKADRWRIVGRRGGLSGIADRLRALSRPLRWLPAFAESGGRVIAGSCSARTRASLQVSKRFPRVGALPPPGRVWSERGIDRRRRDPARLSDRAVADRRRGRRARCDRRLRAGGRLAAVGRAGGSGGRVWYRWPGSRRGRGTAGTSCFSEQRSCSRGTRTRCSMQGSSSRSPPWPRSSSSSLASSRRWRAIPCRARWRKWSRSPARAAWRRRRSCSRSSGSIPLYSIPANALAAPVVAPLLGIALVTAIIFPIAPPVASALAWVNGWLAAYLAGCARLDGRAPVCDGHRSDSTPARPGDRRSRLSPHPHARTAPRSVRRDRARCRRSSEAGGACTPDRRFQHRRAGFASRFSTSARVTAR